MTNAPGSEPSEQPLRIRWFSIENFRTFVDVQTVPLSVGATVLHGDSGSGKSTALAALDVFFRTLALLLEPGQVGHHALGWGAAVPAFGRSEALLGERDRPVAGRATVLQALVEGEGVVAIQFVPAGAKVAVSITGGPSDRAGRDRLAARLFPFGAGSRPLAILDARRRPLWLPKRQSESLLSPTLASELYGLQTSRVASERERWRAFADTIASFPTLRGALVSIEVANGAYELVVEHRGRIVLGLDELSSGEQELATMTAGVLLARAAIVAVQEPELGLDVSHQRLWREVCEKQLAAGHVQQLIFESHSVTFDGPRVVRFSRDEEGRTRVESAAAGSDDALADRAREQGAEKVHVTKDGYTQLPSRMREELKTADGDANVWFLRGKDRWEAWPEVTLEALLGDEE